MKKTYCVAQGYEKINILISTEPITAYRVRDWLGVDCPLKEVEESFFDVDDLTSFLLEYSISPATIKILN